MFIKLLALATLSLVTVSWSVHADEAPADVRLVLDVSGSMKANDPNNLRQPSVDLLVRLLPEGSEAGVWTFGKFVNMLVKHGPVDDQWKRQAGLAAGKINSVGLNTNIGEALERASYIKDKESNFNRSIIILTDGMVDIAKQPEKNQKEWRRIIDDVLPKVKDAGFTIHTVALSKNADKNLLEKISLATDGIASTAHTADELMQVFLQAFDAAAPSQQLPMGQDNTFVVDSSVEEFTALIFRRDKQEMTQLIGPDNAAFDANSTPIDVAWFRADNYDLVTVKQPLEGSWNALVEMAPGSRIAVMSNMSLRVEPLPINIKQGGGVKLRFVLQENGKTITRPEFLSLMRYHLEILHSADNQNLKPLWREKLDAKVPPADGIYEASLPTFEAAGTYELVLKVDGKSFSRQYKHRFNVRHPFSAQLKKKQGPDGNLSYSLVVRANSTQIDYANTQVVATVYPPDNRKVVVSLSLSEQDNWQAPVVLTQAGRYRIKVKVEGKLTTGDSFSHLLNPLLVEYDPKAAFDAAADVNMTVQDDKKKSEDEYLEPGSLVSPTPVLPEAEKNKTELEKQEEAKQEEVIPEPPPEPLLPSWMLYAILGLGNILILGLGYFAYRKIMGGPKKEEVIEEQSEDTEPPGAEDEQEAIAEPELEVTDSDDEEPPMEDLGMDDDDMGFGDDEDDLDMATLLEEEPQPTPEPDPEPQQEEPEAEPESKPDPEPEPEPPPEPEPEPKQPEANVPGLNIPESELDDAISDLINELGDDDEEESKSKKPDMGDEINLDDFDFDDDD